jgi:hypothetical protein
MLNLAEKCTGKARQAEKIIMQVPVSLFSFEKKTVVSGPSIEIFDKIAAFDIEAEKMIISQLVTELNENHGADLATDVIFDRGSRPSLTDDGEKAVIIVGSSHANYLATSLATAGFKAIVVEMRPWRPNLMTVEEARSELALKVLNTPNLVAIIFWCLDSAAFYSQTEDSILPPVRDVSGQFHIHGSLITAPSEMFGKSVKQCIPLFNISSAAKKIILSPLPRYWQSRCCDDDEHVANIDDVDFQGMLFSGLDSLRRIIKDTLHCNNVRDVTILNSSQLCVAKEGSRQTSTDVRAALDIMWGDDPVHPNRDVYDSLAEHLVFKFQSQSEATPSTSSDRPLKRPRWLETESSDTVTPKPPGRGRGRGRGGRGWFGRGNRGQRGFPPRGRGRGSY